MFEEETCISVISKRFRACEPLEIQHESRLEAEKESKNVGTYMIGTKVVTTFGRDAETNDFLLANPSISRNHAAVIHNEKGGIYIVDLMSRHGTYVGKKKLPPHDPTLLHGKKARVQD